MVLRVRIARRVARMLVVVVACGACTGIGVGAFLGSAFVTGQAWTLMAAGTAAFAAAAASAAWLLSRRRRDSFRRLLAIIAGVPVVVPAVYSGVEALTLPSLRPPPANVHFWDLPGGDRIAYRLIRGSDPGLPPVIFVHGGPGVSDLEADSGYFGQLSRLGNDVYVYDQIGSGFSARLGDPTGYTLARGVRDLEEIQTIIGAQKVILIGHSYGAAVASYYAARYPGHVARLILSSPGPLPAGLAQNTFSLRARMSLGDAVSLYSHILAPQAILTYALLQINPRAAHNFSGDAPMDRRFDAIYPAVAAALHCPGKGQDIPAPPDLGFYANQTPQSPRHGPTGESPALLASVRGPALIIKGSCDYLSWQSAIAYEKALSGTAVTLVYLRGAGHNAYQDLPAKYLTAVSKFIQGKQVPYTYPGSAQPAGYGR